MCIEDRNEHMGTRRKSNSPSSAGVYTPATAVLVVRLCFPAASGAGALVAVSVPAIIDNEMGDVEYVKKEEVCM